MMLGRLFVGVVVAAAAMTAHAQNYSFNCITNNNAADCAIGVAQFGLIVTDNGSTVDFRFTNTGTAASSITDVYFGWSSSTYALLQGTLTDSGAGVSFDWGASPPNLPGGSAIGFTSYLAADSNNPTQPNGVNPGEWLNVSFATNADLIAGLNSGGLNIGIHTQGYATGGSESLVVSPIPEPETYAMLLVGLTLLGFKVRRRIRTASAVAA